MIVLWRDGSCAIRNVRQFVFRNHERAHQNERLLSIRISGMEPPQTKKQTIKNQKQKGASEHRLGSAKHIRIRENEPRGGKKKGIIQSH